MKRKWLNIIIIITILLLIGSVAISVVIPSTKNHEINEDIFYSTKSDYFNDWYVDHVYTNDYRQSSTSCNKTDYEENPSGKNWYNQTIGGSIAGPMDSPWSMQGHDVYHTCRSPYSTENNSGAEIWYIHGYEAGGMESSAVIDKNNIVYFGTIGGDSALYALYPNGTRKWRYPATGLIWCTPALAEDGTIYFSTWLSAYFHALNPDGTLKWLFGTGPASSPTIADDGTIYVGADNSIVWAINPNGTLKWSYKTGYIVMGCPAIGADGTIYIGSGDRYLYALFPNGTLRWRFATGAEIKGSASIAPDRTIYVPSFDGYLYALYPNGTMKWRVSTGGSIAAAGVALAEDGTIYGGTEQLRAFYPNGTLKWTTNVQGSIYGTVPAVSADGTIYVSAGSSLVAVNPDGTEKWQKILSNEQIRSSPSIGENDRIYVGSTYSDYGYLHAFGPQDPNAPSAPTITGQTNGRIKRTYEYTFTSTSPLGKQIYYLIDWGDGTTTDWLGPYNSGEPITMNHSWSEQGTYNITTRAKDTDNLWGPWGTLSVTMGRDPNTPTTPTITGETHGNIKKTYEYTFTSTSPVGNKISYQVDWGDSAATDWLGPYNSGEPLTMNHSWSEQGNYQIKAKARDTLGAESDWGTLSVTMPTSYTQPLLQFFELLFQRFPHAFPFLRYLLGCNQ